MLHCFFFFFSTVCLIVHCHDHCSREELWKVHFHVKSILQKGREGKGKEKVKLNKRGDAGVGGEEGGRGREVNQVREVMEGREGKRGEERKGREINQVREVMEGREGRREREGKDIEEGKVIGEG